jgi:hypothetical protein
MFNNNCVRGDVLCKLCDVLNEELQVYLQDDTRRENDGKGFEVQEYKSSEFGNSGQLGNHLSI